MSPHCFMVRLLAAEAVSDVGTFKGVFTDLEDALVWSVAVARDNVFDRVIVERVTINDIAPEQEQVFVCGPIGRRTDEQLTKDEILAEEEFRAAHKALVQHECTCCRRKGIALRELPNGPTCDVCVDLLIYVAIENAEKFGAVEKCIINVV